MRRPTTIASHTLFVALTFFVALGAASSERQIAPAQVGGTVPTGFLPAGLSQIPIDEVTVMTSVPSDKPRAACTGEWQGPTDTDVGGIFTGDETWVVYQDPIETGCTQTYPFAIETIHWDLRNMEGYTLSFGPFRVIIFAVDRSTPGCPRPGAALRMSTELTVELAPYSEDGIHVFYSTPVCMSGPYFIGFWVDAEYNHNSIRLTATDPSPDPDRSCAFYWDAGTQGGSWYDYPSADPFNLDYRMWSEGQSVTSSNCGCNTGPIGFYPERNDVDVPVVADSASVLFVGPHDPPLNSSTFLLYGSVSGYYDGTISEAHTAHGKFDISDALDFHPGEQLTAVLTNNIQCDGERYFAWGYQWSWTAGVDPASPGTFADPDNFAIDDAPRCICTADLDGDGDFDLATANVTSDNMSVILNNGDGTYSAAVNYASGNYTHGVVAADLDSDGDMDLAAANYSAANVAVFVNNSDGTFYCSDHPAVAVGPRSVCASDLDNDGDIDLVTANSSSDNVSVLLNHGDGTFAAAVNYAAGDTPRSICAADLDGDGHADLATANFDGDDVMVLVGQGDGSFAAPVAFAAGDDPMGIVAADLDHDSNLDLVTVDVYNHLALLLINETSSPGSPAFAAPVPVSVGVQPLVVVAADLNGDGSIDLATGNGVSDDVSVLVNDGSGSFVETGRYDAADGPYGLVAGDFDGDQDIDLAVANNNSDNVSILLNESLGCCVPPLRGDVKHDGDPGETGVDVADLVYLVNYMFKEGPEPPCWAEADVNATGVDGVDIQDLVYLVNYMFKQGPDPLPCP